MEAPIPYQFAFHSPTERQDQVNQAQGHAMVTLTREEREIGTRLNLRLAIHKADKCLSQSVGRVDVFFLDGIGVKHLAAVVTGYSSAICLEARWP